MVHRQLKDIVPVPEVLGWAEDGDQVFIYMSLIEGETLEQRWGVLNEEEREAICTELNGMVKAWSSLKYPDQGLYVGKISKFIAIPMQNYVPMLKCNPPLRWSR